MIRFHLAVLLSLLFVGVAGAQEKPNIILIYGDDVGFGDVSCNGAKSVSTPAVDRAAREGLRLTSGYCSSATCTPSRFSMIQGMYAFRQKGTGVLPGDAALIIDTKKMTLPKVLKQAGYATGVVGKWHIGLGDGVTPIEWNGRVSNGPAEVGFDYSFIMPATQDRVPCVYLENQRVVNLDPNDPIKVDYKQPFDGEDSYKNNPEKIKMPSNLGHNFALINGIGRIGYMAGGKAARWDDTTMADVYAAKATDFIDKNKDHPFFLYYSTTNIHVPRTPNARWVGKTGMGPRGDSILEFDDGVAKVMAKLDELKLSEKTILIISSDNGPVLDDGYDDDAVKKLGAHKPAGPWRGGKYSIFEGGTRIPMIVRWPGRVKPGVSDAIVSQVDFAASFAALTGVKLSKDDVPDSLNVLPALLGDSPTGRDHTIEHANKIAIRWKNWKFIPAGKAMEPAEGPGVRLFDLSKDPGETENIAEKNPEIVKQLSAQLEKIRNEFESTGVRE